MEGSKTIVIQPFKKTRDTKRIENILREFISRIVIGVLRYYPLRYYPIFNHIFPKMSTLGHGYVFYPVREKSRNSMRELRE
jgi:hypothetical protein